MLPVGLERHMAGKASALLWGKSTEGQSKRIPWHFKGMVFRKMVARAVLLTT